MTKHVLRGSSPPLSANAVVDDAALAKDLALLVHDTACGGGGLALN